MARANTLQLGAGYVLTRLAYPLVHPATGRPRVALWWVADGRKRARA